MPTKQAIGKSYGYARVSTKEQKEDRQTIVFREQGIKKCDVFIDKQSGKDFDRPAYKHLMRKLKSGDTLFIKSIDRLGRNYGEIIEQWRILTQERGVAIVVLDMPLLDTREKECDLVNVLISNLVLQVLSYVAETERTYIHQRQAEGIAIAKAQGIRFGRPPKERPHKFIQLYETWQRKEISARAAARELGIAHKTFFQWAASYSATISG